MNNPLVSIIVPCYNAERFLAETLDCVFAQSYVNWECIIMDDGSTDNSGQIAVSYQQKDKRYKYLHQSNKGTAAARNNAIAASSGEYLLPLDADDKISPQYIEQAVAILQKNNDIKLVYCKAILFGNLKGPWDIPAYSLKEMLFENMIFCTALFRRKDFDKTPGFSEEMGGGFEDWDFWLTFLNETDKVYQIPEAHFYYRTQHDSRNPHSDVQMQLKLRRMIYERHKNLFDKYFQIPDLLYDYNKMRKEFNALQKVYSATLHSATFKVGRIILKPYWFIKNIFSSKSH